MTARSRLNSFFTVLASDDTYIGRSWTDGRGRPRVVQDKQKMRDGSERYLVGTGYDGKPAEQDRSPDLVRPEDIANLIAQENRMWEANRASQEREAARDLEQRNKEAERISLDGFETLLSPMARGKAVSALTKSVNRNGRPIPIRDLIRQLVGEGWRVETSRHSGRILSAPDDRFLSEKQLTKIGLDYADYLARKR